MWLFLKMHLTVNQGWSIKFGYKSTKSKDPAGGGELTQGSGPAVKKWSGQSVTLNVGPSPQLIGGFLTIKEKIIHAQIS